MSGAVIAALTSIALAAPTSVFAASPVSQATGQLVRSTAISTPTGRLQGAVAQNANNPDVALDAPLDPAAVSALVSTVAGSTALFGSTGVVQLADVGQYAQANADGSSLAFSGAVDAAPALAGVSGVTPGTDVGAPGAGLTAKIVAGDLAALRLTAAITDIAASASQSAAGVQSGRYQMGELTFTLEGASMMPVTAFSTLIRDLNLRLRAVVLPPATDPFLPTGTVVLSTADIEQVLPGGDVNNLPPDTDVTNYVAQAVYRKIAAQLQSVADQVLAGKTGTALVVATAILATVKPSWDDALNTFDRVGKLAIGGDIVVLTQIVLNHRDVGVTFSQTAARVGLGIGGSIATIDLANASVGPNAGPSTSTPSPTPTTIPPNPAADPGLPGAQGHGGDSGSLAATGDAGALGSLAFAIGALATGVALAGLISLRRRRSTTE